METTLDQEALRQWRALRACVESLGLAAQSAIMIRPTAARRVIRAFVAARQAASAAKGERKHFRAH